MPKPLNLSVTTFFAMLAALILACSAFTAAVAQASPKPLPGTTWSTEGGRSHVTFELDADNQLVGRFVYLSEEPVDGPRALDTNNSDPALRSRQLVGTAFVYGFKARGDDWVRGRIYNPDDGRTYRSRINRNADGSLAVKGCVGPICRTQTWMPVLSFTPEDS